MGEPGGVGVGIDLAGGEGEGVEDGLFLGGFQLEAIDTEKSVGRHESGSLVSIQKRMIFDDTVSVTSGEVEKRRLSVIEKLRRAAKRGIEKPLVPDAVQATEASQEFSLDREDDFPSQPDGFGHLASSLRALR